MGLAIDPLYKNWVSSLRGMSKVLSRGSLKIPGMAKVSNSRGSSYKDWVFESRGYVKSFI